MTITLTPVQGNPFEDQEKKKLEPSSNVDLGLPKLPVPTEQTPEITSAMVGPMESFKMFLGTLSTTDPRALQDIVLKSVEGAQGGEDAQGNPYVVINNKPFYTNKTGLSPVDAIGFGGDLLAFLPVGRMASMAKNVATRLGIAGLTSGAISTGKEFGAQLLGSEQQLDTTKIALDAAFGGGGQLVGDALTTFIRNRKPVFNASGNISAQFSDELKKAGININDFGSKGQEVLVSAYKNLGSSFSKEAERVTGAARSAEAGGIPLTAGQSTGDFRQIAKEEAMRQGGRGGIAQKIVQKFDEGQKAAIGQKATTIGQEIAPASTTGTQSEAGGMLFETLRGKQKELKGAVAKSYDETDLRSLAIPTATTSTLTSKISDAIKQGDFILNEVNTPAAANAYSSLVNIIPKVDKANVTQINLKSLESTRRSLGQYYKAAANDADRNAVSILTKQFDDWLDDTVTKGLASGDLDQLAKLKEARALSKDYFNKFKVDPRSADVDAQKVIEKIISKDLTPVETMNYLFGAAKLGDNQTAVRTAKKYKEIFGEASPEFDEFRKAAYLRLVQDTQGNIKPASKIIGEVDELILGRGSALAKEIFTPEQVKSLRDFRSAISKTVTPAEATNPSKTGYEIARLGEDIFKGVGIMSALGGDIGTGAAISAVGGVLKPARGAIQALQATRGVTAPALRSMYGAPVGIASGNIAADLLREREDRQLKGLLGE
jgi:hypothetical protein